MKCHFNFLVREVVTVVNLCEKDRSDGEFVRTLVVINTLWAVPLVILGLGIKGTVDRNLEIVTAQAMSVCVRV